MDKLKERLEEGAVVLDRISVVELKERLEMNQEDRVICCLCGKVVEDVMVNVKVYVGDSMGRKLVYCDACEVRKDE